MFLLTREVRLNITADAAAGGVGGGNGHAGSPPVDGPFYYVAVRVTLAGEPDPASSYVRNIKDIDEQVHAIGLPYLRRQLFNGTRPSYPFMARELYQMLAKAWPGSTLTQLALLPSPGTEYVILAEEPPMIRLSHRFEFSAAHRLHNPALDAAENRRLFGKCNNPLGHGHNYEVQVTLRLPADAATSMAELERIVDQHAISRLDHKNLNQEVEDFANVNPSVEQIAKVIYRWLKPPLQDLASVTVWETPRTWCEYSEG